MTGTRGRARLRGGQVVERLLATVVAGEQVVAGAGDLRPQLLELGGQLVAGVGLGADVVDQGRADLLPALHAGGGLVVGDGGEHPGHHHGQRHQHRAPSSASAGRRRPRRGPGLRGLGVRRVERLGEHVVEQRGAQGARASRRADERSRHRARRGAARSARTMPDDLDDVEGAGQQVEGGAPDA